MTGWPDKQITPEITLYFSKHHEITVKDGSLLWGIHAIAKANSQSQSQSQSHFEPIWRTATFSGALTLLLFCSWVSFSALED